MVDQITRMTGCNVLRYFKFLAFSDWNNKPENTAVGCSLLCHRIHAQQRQMWLKWTGIPSRPSNWAWGSDNVRVIQSHGVYAVVVYRGGLFQKHADNEKMTHCRHWQRAHSSGPSLLSGFAVSAHRAEEGERGRKLEWIRQREIKKQQSILVYSKKKKKKKIPILVHKQEIHLNEFCWPVS